MAQRDIVLSTCHGQRREVEGRGVIDLDQAVFMIQIIRATEKAMQIAYIKTRQ